MHMMVSTMRPLARAVTLAVLGLGSVLLAPTGLLPAADAATCTSGGGVSVVVDYRELGGGIVTACAPDGGGKSASAVFSSVGVAISYATRQPGFVCRVNGQPASDPCVNASPANAYWGLWWADGSAASWTYASSGVGSLTVPAGGSVAWSWQQDRSGSGAVPPGVAPPVHASSPTPSPTSSSPAPSPTASPSSGGSGSGSGSGSGTGGGSQPSSPSSPSGGSGGSGGPGGPSPSSASVAHRPRPEHPPRRRRPVSLRETHSAVPGRGRPVRRTTRGPRRAPARGPGRAPAAVSLPATHRPAPGATPPVPPLSLLQTQRRARPPRRSTRRRTARPGCRPPSRGAFSACS